MRTPVRNGWRSGPAEIRDAIERFLKAAQKHVLLEPGEESIDLCPDNVSIEVRAAAVTLQAWNERRNLVRRITAVSAGTRGRLELKFERFDKRSGALSLVDALKRDPEQLNLRISRWEFREQFRRFLRRQYPSYKVVEVTTEADLEESLSPAYARALLRQGSFAWAAIGAGPECLNVDGVLSFGLIWLDYLRRREPRLAIAGLILLLPAGRERTTCLRLRFMDSRVAQYEVFAYAETGVETALDLRDYGNLDSRLESVCRGADRQAIDWTRAVAALPHVETIDEGAGNISFRVRGTEFARAAADQVIFGLETKRVARASNLLEIEQLAEELALRRSAERPDRRDRQYLDRRELWLESQVRSHLEEIDAGLCPSHVYGQTPAFTAGERGMIDLLAAGYNGRLAVLELKTSEDIHLPLQALDYWMRVKWHLDQDEFQAAGYFPGRQLSKEAPRILLIAPALDFHPTNERVLRYFSPAVEVQRIGVGAEWQKHLKVMYRM